MGCAATLPHNRAICRLSRQNLLQQHRYNVLKMSINGASTTFGIVSRKIIGLCLNIKPQSNYGLPLWTKIVAGT
jgi:hypothetical protein